MASRSSKRQRSGNGTAASGRNAATTTRGGAAASARRAGNGGRPRRLAWLAGGLVVAAIAVVVGIAAFSGSTPGSAPVTGAPGTVIQANGGTWTNITPDTLATMLRAKAFTLLNVKTPYMGEIAGTDLWIPYIDLAAQASKLPADKKALVVVYCRSGNESAIAAQTLLDLGYTNIENLDGGMTAWTASGRSLVQVNRS